MLFLIDRNFEMIFTNIYKVYSKADVLNRFIYKEYKHPELNLYLEHFKSLFPLSLKTDEVNSYKRIINTCLYVYFELFPEIREDLVSHALKYDLYKIKIFKQKQTWYEYVNKFKPKKHVNKYIDKEIIEKNIESVAEFRKERLNEIMKWVLDDEKLLSDFYYSKDLLFKQRKSVIKTDPIFLLLKEINGNDHHPISLFLENFPEDNLDMMLFPETFLSNPTEFIFGNYRLEDLEITETNGNYAYKIVESSEVTEMIPAADVITDELSGLSLDLSTDRINSNSFDFKVLSHILRLSFDDLIRGVSRTSFSLKQICEVANLPINTGSYNRIKKALILAKSKILISNYESVSMVYTHIDKIFIPTNNEDKEKIWTIEWGSHILKEIELKKYKTIYYEQFLLKSDLAVLISRMIIKDVGNSKQIKYTWQDIYNATLITGKPSEKKKKIIDALNEIVNKNNPLITDYQTDEGNNWFILTVNENVIRKNSLLNKPPQ